eukprot:12696071-Ditylum_brightwellii.AAC.2
MGTYIVKQKRACMASSKQPSLPTNNWHNNYKNMDTEHLISILKQYYSISINWDGCNYCGLTFDWSYNGKCIDASVLHSVPRALTKYKHHPPKHP